MSLLSRLRTITEPPETDVYWTPPTVRIGRHTYGKPEITTGRGPHATVEIGAFCSIAPGVTLLTNAGHHTEWVTTFPVREMLELPGQWEHHPVNRGPTIIGSDVWIGQDALILDGLTIGHGAIVAARAVVTKDVRPYAIVGGNPAREIRRRFTDHQVERLLRIAWWDWPEDQIVREVEALNGWPIERFLERFG